MTQKLEDKPVNIRKPFVLSDQLFLPTCINTHLRKEGVQGYKKVHIHLGPAEILRKYMNKKEAC